MRHFLITIMLVFAGMFHAAAMNDGHVLTSLWTKREEARKADRPQQEAEILRQIKQEALQKRLPVDFYDAATEYVSAVTRRDWKQSEPMKEELAADVKRFDHPLVTFLWMRSWASAGTAELWAYVKENSKDLDDYNPALYRGLQGYLSGALQGFVKTDLDYVLWSLLQYTSTGSALEGEITQALREQLKGAYPGEGALDYYLTRRQYSNKNQRPELKAALQALQQRFNGKALGLFPEADLLEMEMQDLEELKASSSRYKVFHKACQNYETRRKGFTGTEKTLADACTKVSGIVRSLEAQDLKLDIKDASIRVFFKNLYLANVTLRDGEKTLQTWKAVNFAESFYVQDTVTIDLPQLPDGHYTLEAVNGKLSARHQYNQMTLSIATRPEKVGNSVYVADYKTGEPLKKVTLELFKGDKSLAVSTLKLDGFTRLPEAFEKQIEAGNRYALVASDGQRKSEKQYFYQGYASSSSNSRLNCNLYGDRGAYQPGDVVHFKGVVYEGNPMVQFSVCKGKELEVVFCDAEDNVLEKRKMTTNDWGSFAGDFTIPKGLRNGVFTIEAGKLATLAFRVDEFVLPSFQASFDPLTELYLAGDEVPVCGRVQSYSGHNLSGARAMLEVKRYGSVVFRQEQPLAADNTFAFSYLAKEPGYYYATVTITDASGETLAFSRSSFVSDDFLSIEVELPDALQNTDVSMLNYDAWRYNRPTRVVGSKQLEAVLSAKDVNGHQVPLPVQYQLLRSGKVLAQGEVPSGQSFSEELPGSGFYTLKCTVTATRPDGRKASGEWESAIVCVLPGDAQMPAGVKRLFVPGEQTVGEGQRIQARLGSGEGRLYVVATLFGDGREVLASRQIVVEEGELATIGFPYQKNYPDAVRLQLFTFKDGQAHCYDRQYRRAKDRLSLPLRFTRFQDKAYPGTEYSFELQTAPGAEVLVAAWDKSLDAIEENEWPEVTLWDYSVSSVNVSSTCGRVGGTPLYDVRVRGLAMEKASNVSYAAAPMADRLEEVVEEEAIPYALAQGRADAAADEGVQARTDFAPALTFQPQLYPEADGKLSFRFSTSDKLSTFYVRAYAHDTAMRNALEEREMVVTLPVKVSLLEPRFLYEGDVYEAAVTVSSIDTEPVSGTLVFRAGNNVQQVPVTLAPGAVETRKFTLTCHSERSEESSDTLVMKASFIAAEFTDAVQVSVPVYPAAQALTEAHSAVLRAGEDREALLRELQGRFVNVPASEALLKEITVLDMVRDAIPSHVDPTGKDVLSLSEAWYIRLMASRLDACHSEAPTSCHSEAHTSCLSERSEESSDTLNLPILRRFTPQDDNTSSALLDQILSFQNADGGFAWFEGMPSNAQITAVLLERVAKLRDRGFEVPDLTSAVKFLDAKQFGDAFPVWCGWLSDAQYMRVRSLYPEVPFQVKPVSASGKKRLKEFKKAAKEYLLPSKKAGRGLEGQILAKARRLLTLRSLVASDQGRALAKAWGLPTGSKLTKSIQADVVSLLEYAVEHRDGGWYYPNAVMPWRGLMESEAYAHALLCELLNDDSPQVADGIRLWLMLQKETQHWDTEPAYIDAITAILDGSSAVLDTRVMVLTANYEAPFREVKAAGNGFTLERHFFRGEEEIQPGDSVTVGDKIDVKYSIWNAENRSFVRLTAGREASLQPVQQLSGPVGSGLIRPWRGGLVWSFTPHGYRNVTATGTDYYFDSYPEEKTEIGESFFVVRAGTFVAPVTVIESLYAPHYRANSAFRPALVSVSR